jgi:predicted Zn-dependent peptidase
MRKGLLGAAVLTLAILGAADAAPRPRAPIAAGLAPARVAMAAGTTQDAQIPAHPSQLEFTPIDFTPPVAADHRHELANGVVVFVVEDHTLPLVNVQLRVRTGAYLEPPDKAGLAALTGSQIRAGGTASMTAAELDEEAAFLAAQIGSYVGATQGGASLNCLTKDLGACLDLFFDMLRNPAFEEDRLELAKSQALQGMQRRNDSTGRIEGREWNRLMRGSEHFSTRPATEASISSISREDLLGFHQAYFHPGNFIFAVSGDVDPAEILASLEHYLDGWEIDHTPLPDVPVPDFTPQPGLYLVDKADVNQGRVSLGHLGAMRDNPDRYTLAVMNDLLGGGGFTSRLMTRVRSDEGLAYSVGSSFSLGLYYPGVFRASFQSGNPTIARAVAIVLTEIERMRTREVSPQELADSKASFIETFTRRFSSAAAVAGLFASDELTGRETDYWSTYRERISAVTAADVLRVAQEYLHPQRLVILAVGNVDEMLRGDPDNPEYVLEHLSPSGLVVRIPLPDPMTMEYPQQ